MPAPPTQSAYLHDTGVRRKSWRQSAGETLILHAGKPESDPQVSVSPYPAVDRPVRQVRAWLSHMSAIIAVSIKAVFIHA
jgi:hypothetical protein